MRVYNFLYNDYIHFLLTSGGGAYREELKIKAKHEGRKWVNRGEKRATSVRFYFIFKIVGLFIFFGMGEGNLKNPTCFCPSPPLKKYRTAPLSVPSNLISETRGRGGGTLSLYTTALSYKRFQDSMLVLAVLSWFQAGIFGLFISAIKSGIDVD